MLDGPTDLLSNINTTGKSNIISFLFTTIFPPNCENTFFTSMKLLFISILALTTGNFVSTAPTHLNIYTKSVVDRRLPSKTLSNHIESRTDKYDILAPQFSPYFPNLHIATDVISSYNGIGRYATHYTKLSRQTLDLSKYPEPWSKPDIYHEEVQAAINSIDWDLVPDINVRAMNDFGDIDFASYDESTDSDCWWSASNCKQPKVAYIPEDIYTCPRKGDWGLTFDDGPFNLRDSEELYADEENPYAEPALYDFLEKHHIKSNLFVSNFISR